MSYAKMFQTKVKIITNVVLKKINRRISSASEVRLQYVYTRSYSWSKILNFCCFSTANILCRLTISCWRFMLIMSKLHSLKSVLSYWKRLHWQIEQSFDERNGKRSCKIVPVVSCWNYFYFLQFFLIYRMFEINEKFTTKIRLFTKYK